MVQCLCIHWPCQIQALCTPPPHKYKGTAYRVLPLFFQCQFIYMYQLHTTTTVLYQCHSYLKDTYIQTTSSIPSLIRIQMSIFNFYQLKTREYLLILIISLKYFYLLTVLFLGMIQVLRLGWCWKFKSHQANIMQQDFLNNSPY